MNLGPAELRADMRDFLARRTETQRRIIGLLVFLGFVATAVWLTVAELGDAPEADSDAVWMRFAIAAAVSGVVMAAYGWKKLTDPKFDTALKFDPRPYLFLAVGVTLLFRRTFLTTLNAKVTFAGIAAGFFGGLLVIHLYDALTNNLSKGRSWRYPDGVPEPDGHSSNTSSPT